MQYTDNLGWFPKGKSAAVVRHYPAFCVFLLCTVFSCLHTTGCEAYSFATDGYGILTCVQMWVRAIHTKGVQAQTSMRQEVTWRDRKTAPHTALPGDQTQGLPIRIPTI